MLKRTTNIAEPHHKAKVNRTENTKPTPNSPQNTNRNPQLQLQKIFSKLNPSIEIAKVRYNGKLLHFIVPSERALTPAKFALPVGFVLAIPWLNSARKRMVTKPPSALVQASSTVSQKSEKTKA